MQLLSYSFFVFLLRGHGYDANVMITMLLHVGKVFLSMHCKQDPIYVFPEMKLRGLRLPNFHIHVSVSD
jgi:hypothetical protein